MDHIYAESRNICFAMIGYSASSATLQYTYKHSMEVYQLDQPTYKYILSFVQLIRFYSIAQIQLKKVDLPFKLQIQFKYLSVHLGFIVQFLLNLKQDSVAYKMSKVLLLLRCIN